MLEQLKKFPHKLLHRNGLVLLENTKIPLFIHGEENKELRPILNQVLLESVHLDPLLVQQAFNQKVGHLNINDQRMPPLWGRVNDPEDILGTSLIKDGKLVPKSFEPMPTHRILSTNGLFQLTPFLHEKLLKALS